jgi:hypothetical protein
MHAPRMLSAAFVCMTISFWYAAGCYAQTSAPAASVTPAATATPAATPAPAAAAAPAAIPAPAAAAAPAATAASAAPPDGGEVGSLKAQVAALEKVLEQMQRVDSKIASIAPWFAAMIAFVAVIVTIMPVLFTSYEVWIRSANEKKFDEYKADLRSDIGRQMKSTQDEITRTVVEKMDDRIDHIVRTELRRITQNVEGDYSKNLAQVETSCYCFIRNEFPRKWRESDGPAALEQMHVFRYLLIHLVGGDRKERLNALHRLANEFVDLCGPTTKNSLATLLGSLENDIRFARSDLSRALDEMKERCLRPSPVAASS